MAALVWCLCGIIALINAEESRFNSVKPTFNLDRFAAMERLLTKQSKELSELKSFLKKQDTEIATLGQLLKQRDTEMVTMQQQLKERNCKALSEKNMGGEAAKAKVVRSDDGGPMEAVVTLLSQHVSQMDADMQAFMTKTAHDITHTQQLATNAINNLQLDTTDAIRALNSTNILQDAAIREARTSTFTHWGRSVCGPNNELFYSGVIGGSLFNETGAATNFLCLTMEPVMGTHPIHRHFGAHLYGSEYQTGDVHQDKDGVCAVCRVPFSTTIMVPGTNVCSSGWHRQYTGYLMSGGFSDPAGTEFICVDAIMDSAPHSNLNQDGKSLFYTSAHCGSLPCTPYVDGMTILCAVCSK